jgi:excinuclease UvrABC nuclease subunit
MNFPLEKLIIVKCVYFLFNDIRLQYIGRTKDLKNRIYQHVGISGNLHLEFDKIGFIQIEDEQERGDFETKMIEKYLPPCNGDCWI